jgi:hypothetical protein
LSKAISQGWDLEKIHLGTHPLNRDCSQRQFLKVEHSAKASCMAITKIKLLSFTFKIVKRKKGICKTAKLSKKPFLIKHISKIFYKSLTSEEPALGAPRLPEFTFFPNPGDQNRSPCLRHAITVL